MKVFISVDIEGVTGIANWSQCGRPSAQVYDYPFGRRMLTHDVNAAVRGARAAGATEIVIKDSHADCKNLLIDQLEPDVRLVTGFSGTAEYMMQGIDDSFGAVFLVGYHATAGTINGVLEHALAGGIHRCWINGQIAGEIAASAALAGEHSVATVLVTSDQAGCAEAQATLPGVQTYSTKKGMGKYLAEMKHPSETGPGIEQAARNAIENARDFPPYKPTAPVTLRLEFRTVEEVDMASVFPGLTRLDGYTLEFTRDTFGEAHQVAFCVFQLSIRGRSWDIE